MAMKRVFHLLPTLYYPDRPRQSGYMVSQPLKLPLLTQDYLILLSLQLILILLPMVFVVKVLMEQLVSLWYEVSQFLRRQFQSVLFCTLLVLLHLK